jgi:arylsulfatase A-like enzyme
MRRRDMLLQYSAPALFSAPTRRNAVLLYCEQFQHNVASFAGGPARTPNLDKFAAQAVTFRTACTTTGLCSPNRAALFTGRLGHRTGLDDNCNVWHSRLTGLDTSQSTLIEWAARAGYFTGYYGKWHLGLDGPIRRGAQRFPKSGFDRTGIPPGKVSRKPDFSQFRRYHSQGARFDEKPGFYSTAPGAYEDSNTGAIARQGCEFLKEAAAQSKSFFLTLSFNAVHPPYDVPTPFSTMYDWRSRELPSSLNDTFAGKPAYQNDVLWPFHDTGHMSPDDWRRAIAFYHGFVSMLDHALGQVFDALRAGGLADNTMVIVVADHGDMTGAHNRYDKGPYSYDEIVRIPLLIRAPGFAQRDVRRHVSSIDINRTLCDWMALDPATPNTDSRSLLPLMEGGDNAWRSPDEAFYRYEWYNGLWFGIRAIRTHDFKYCFNPCGVDELYDLGSDPAEMNNLSGKSGLHEKESELQRRLLAHLDAAGDHMLASKLRAFIGPPRL